MAIYYKGKKLSEGHHYIVEASGSYEITSNGTYNIKVYEEVLVNVSEGSIAGITYTGDSLSVDNYVLKAEDITITSANSIDVSVSGGNNNVNLSVSNSTIDITNCSNDIHIVDNDPQGHELTVDNMTSEYELMEILGGEY